MVWTKAYVVLVGVREGAQVKPCGTGFFVAPGKVVTARHVVSNGGVDLAGLCIRREGGSWSTKPVSVRWKGAGQVDVAVLDVPEDQGPVPVSPLALFSETVTVVNEVWEAQGYPAVRNEEPNERQVPVKGTTHRCEPGENLLELDVTTAPQIWKGLSGGAVVVNGAVRGVFRASFDGWSEKRVCATPAAFFLRDVKFLSALDLDAGAASLLDAVKTVKETAEGLLDHEVVPTLVGCVAAATQGRLKFAASESRAKVIDALLHALSGLELVTALNGAWADLPDRSSQRPKLSRLLWLLLPFASDWRSWIVAGRAAFSRPEGYLDLPYSTRTVAEAVVAGVDLRTCSYQQIRRNKPEGRAILELSPLDALPVVDPEGTVFAQTAVANLALQLDVCGPGDSVLNDPKRLRREVEETLAFEIEASAPPKRLPRYLLLEEGDLQRRQVGAGQPTYFMVAVRALKANLPSLRILRLGEGVDGETRLALHIGVMYEQEGRS